MSVRECHPTVSAQRVAFDRKRGDETFKLAECVLQVGLIRSRPLNAQLHAWHVVPNKRIQLASASLESDCAADFVLHMGQSRHAIEFLDKPPQSVSERNQLLGAEGNAASGAEGTRCLGGDLCVGHQPVRIGA
jgi:hypothetical protein